MAKKKTRKAFEKIVAKKEFENYIRNIHTPTPTHTHTHIYTR